MSKTPRTDAVDWWGPTHDMFTAYQETAALSRKLEIENAKLRGALLDISEGSSCVECGGEDAAYLAKEALK